MLRFFRIFGLAAALAFGLQGAHAFSLLGPIGADTWQTTEIGFFITPPRFTVDVGGPKNLGEEFRRNTPVLYYACDANFLDFFGSNGLAEVDKAFAVYNTLTNVSLYSPDLSEIPLESRRFNSIAGSLGVLDLKSTVMNLIIEQLGLADSVRYVWNLHDRFLVPNTTCPFGEEYLVVQRNFDPTIATSITQMKTSAYVNDVLYDYQIHDYCTLPPNVADALSEAIEIPVDPDADQRKPVATSVGVGSGVFLTGLTRDDVGGLRYLLSKNNMNVESAGPGTTIFSTNNQPFTLFTSNLTLFAAQALTNNAAALVAIYPGLTITSTSNFFTLVTNVTVTAFFTNSPYAPFPPTPQIGFFTNVTISIATNFVHTFGNVFTVSNSSHGLTTVPLSMIPPPNGTLIAIRQNVAVTNVGSLSPSAPFESFVTVTNISPPRIFATNAVVGDFFILPPGTNCGVAIQSQLLATLAFSTNFVITTTNLAPTNAVPGATNGPESFTQTVVTVVTNRVFLALPIVCPPDAPTLREGIERITFIRRDFDSLLSRVYLAITNEYYLNAVTNNSVLGQRIQRAVIAPDFLITAQDLSPGPDALPVRNAYARNIPNYNAANAYPGLSGPGTIDPPSTFTFNKAAPVFINFGLVNTNAFLTSDTQSPWVIWGSFDGTTNPVVIYPSGLSIDNLNNQVLLQITPPALPLGVLGSPYSVQLQTTALSNWVAPFTWTLSPGAPGLPPGLSLTTDITTSNGVISGTPTENGTFDFSIRVTDGQGRTVDRSYSIMVIQ
jgi:hypothetical protein